MPKTGKVKKGSRNDQNKDKAIHPYSRKAKQIAKRIHHHGKIETSKSARVAKLELVAEKLQWFQDHLDDRESYTKEDLTDLVLEYRNRFEDELEQINIVQNMGKRQMQSRQHTSREDAIRFTKEDEKNHFEGIGMEVPDIVTLENLALLRKWSGQLNLIQCIKLVKVSSSGVAGFQKSKTKSVTQQSASTDSDNDNNNKMDDGGDEEEEDEEEELT